jgi:hypothetical protein
VENFEEYENLSLKILAIMMYNGDFSTLRCDGCDKRDTLNCSMDESEEEQVYYFEPLDVSVNTCPLNCITEEHFSFFDRYKYFEESGNMPEYDQCQTWYWRLHKKFSNYKKIAETTRGK